MFRTYGDRNFQPDTPVGPANPDTQLCHTGYKHLNDVDISSARTHFSKERLKSERDVKEIGACQQNLLVSSDLNHLVDMDRKQEISEVKTDVHLLLDCLKCQVDNPPAVKQAYRTLAAIFTNFPGDEVKDYFRSLGGLEFIVSSNKTVTNVEVLEAAFCCLGCAVENNVFSQKELSTSSQFMGIHRILSDDKSTPRLKHAASYLLLTLVSNNSLGQSLAKKSLCLADLLGLLRTTLPSTGSKDCWFEDAGTTGLEAWSCVATALSMCVNNPQNEENQRVCGFVLPFVFSVLQQFEEEKVIKPMLSFIRFTVANNEANQTQVKRCGGLSVLSDKLKKCGNVTENSLPIAIISTLDACIADHAENAEEVGNLETVKIMMTLLNADNGTQEEKLQIIVTLVHAVEMSGKKEVCVLTCNFGNETRFGAKGDETTPYKKLLGTTHLRQCLSEADVHLGKVSFNQHDIETPCSVREQKFNYKNKDHILEESGMYGLMKSLNGIESGNDELFKAIKYLLQLCLKQDEQEDCKSESAEMLDILKKTEALHRNSGMLLLHKINELSERLETFEQDSSRAYQQLASPGMYSSDGRNVLPTSPALYSSDCRNLLPTSPGPYLSDCHNIKPKHMTDALTPLHTNLEFNREFPPQMLQKKMVDFTPHRTSTPTVRYKQTDQRKDNLLHEHLPQCPPVAMTPSKLYNLTEGNYNLCCGRLPSSYTCKQSDFHHSHENMHYNDSVHHTPMKSDSGCYEKSDNYGLRGINRNQNPAIDENANIKSAYNNYVELSKLNPSVLTDLQPQEYYYYLKSPKNFDERRLQDETGVFESRQLNPLCGNTMHLDRNLDLDMNFINEMGDNKFTSRSIPNIQHATKNLTEVFDYGHKSHVVSNFSSEKQVSDSLMDTMQGYPRTHGHVDIEDSERYVAEPLPTQQYPAISVSSQEHKRHEVNHKHLSKGNGELDQNNNVKSVYRNDVVGQGKEMDMGGHTFYEKYQEDKENESIFLTGIENNSKTAKKSKKYEVRIVESQEDDNLDLREPLIESKTNDSRNVSDPVITTKKALSVDPCVYDTSEKLQNSTNSELDYPILSIVSNHSESNNNTPSCKSHIKTKERTLELSNVKNLDKLSQSQVKKKESDVEFVKPVGRPLRRKTRNSVRRTQPFWKHQPTSDTDTDYGSSCDEESVFDEELVSTAKRNVPNNCQQRNPDIHSLSSLSTEKIQGKSLLNQNLVDKAKCVLQSSASSICSSPGSAYTSCSSLDSSYDSPQNNNGCPGCIGTICDMKLNSRTFNINLETNPFTCSHHRTIRELERLFIKKLPTTAKTKKIKRFPSYEDRKEDRGLSVYDISSDSENELSPLEPNINEQLMTLQKKDLPTPRRRERVSFSQQETQNLMLGVEKFGKSWSLILQNFKFHESRTAVDLKDKHRGIQKRFNKTKFKQKQRGKPFSMCEDRRLLRGIQLHGYNWKLILRTLTFGKDRSSEDLRNRWRTLHKRHLKQVD